MLSIKQRTGILSIFQNALFLVISRIAGKLIRFIYIIFLAKFLTPDLLGIYNFGISWYLTFLPVAVFGFAVTLGIKLGKRPDNIQDIIFSVLFARAATTIVSIVFCLFFGIVFNNEGLTKTIIIIFSTAILGRSFALFTRSCFVATERSQYSLLLESSFRFIECTLGISYILSGGNFLGICVIHSICWFLEGTTGLFLLFNHFLKTRLRFVWGIARDFYLTSFPIALNLFILNALAQAGIIVLKYISSDNSSLGYLTVAFQPVINTAFVLQAFGSAALPVLSRSLDRDSNESIVFTEMMLKICFLIASLLTITVSAFNIEIIAFFFNTKYLNASNTIVLCSLAMLPYYPLLFTGLLLNAAGIFYRTAFYNLLSLFVCISSTLLFSGMQQNAPALGLILGSFAALVFHLMLIHYYVGAISWGDSLLKPLFSSCLAIVASWLIKDHSILAVLFGFSILAAGMFLLKIFNRQEIGYIGRILAVRKNRLIRSY